MTGRRTRAGVLAAIAAGLLTGTALAADDADLLETDRAFARASVERGAAQAFFEFCAPDALQLPMGAAPVQGRERIRDSLVAERPYVLRWTPRAARAAASGELGYTWGTYELETTDPAGNRKVSYGKYVTVWKREAGGPWRVAVDIGNPGPGPEGKP